MSDEENLGIEGALRFAAEQAKVNTVMTYQDGEFVVRHDNQTVEDLRVIREGALPFPKRIISNAILHTVEAFAQYVKRFKTDETVVFASNRGEQATLAAVLDYHNSATEPRWCDHQAILYLALASEWKAWRAREAQPMSGIEFATFIEDRIADVLTDPMADPKMAQLQGLLGGGFATPELLVALSRNLEVNVNSAVKQAHTLSSGEAQIIYTEVHEDGQGQPIKVPQMFAIGVPVFEGGGRYQLPVRLRYRVRQGVVSWSYNLYRADEAMAEEFDAFTHLVASETGAPVLRGEATDQEWVPGA